MNRHLIQVVLGLSYLAVSVIGNASSKRHLVRNVTDINEFNNILKATENVLVTFSTNEDLAALSWMPILSEVAYEVIDFATILFVPCDDAKAMCEELGVLPPPVMLKHYTRGQYNKDYDRLQTVKSLVRFLKDPTGNQPWNELEGTEDVIHIENEEEFNNFLATEKKPILAMFHAPWCPFCDQMKPHFAKAATELKENTVLVGIEGDNEASESLEKKYNIEVYPTIFLFENGVKKFEYGEDLTKEALLEWLKNPVDIDDVGMMPEEPEGEAWSDQKSEVIHLTDATFDPYLAEHPSVLVMFYAPWCSHCKEMKPEYTDAAGILAADGMPGVLAAVDSMKNDMLSDRFEILAFPTVKYFKDGKYAWDFEETTKDKIVEHLKNPLEPPPPPREPQWADEVTAVHHLNTENFKAFTETKKHSLVMFYAPWCGHCQNAKPGFTAAAEELKDEPKVAFAAVDCDPESNDPVCMEYDATSYPTITYLNYGKDPVKYKGKRTEAKFVQFMRKRLDPDWQESMPAKSTKEDDGTHGHFWINVDGAENVKQLGNDCNDFLVTKEVILLMFYAPWCAHSKAMKSTFSAAAKRAKEMELDVVFAALDASAHSDIADQYKVEGYPTIKLFLDGDDVEEYDGDRNVEDLIDFVNLQEYDEDPQSPDGAKWSDEQSAVHHLTDKTFSSFIAENKDVLAIFYSPWCGHCQDVKPHFMEAADKLKDNPDIRLAAVDCTEYSDLCTKNDVGPYPTIKVFQNGGLGQLYSAKMDAETFVNFMSNLKPVSSNKGQDEL